MPQKQECYKEKVPCAICGKKDWCYRMDFGADGILHYCHRIHDTEVCANGHTYLAKKEVSGCTVYEEEEQQRYNREKWIASKKMEYGSKRKFSPKRPESDSRIRDNEKEKVYVEYPAAPPERLDEVYRYFLSLLALESRHESLLRKEWNSPVFPNLYEHLMASWMIRTLPPNDYIRFADQQMSYSCKNLTRKKIMEKMVKKFGSLEGVPGFYQREDGSWTIYNLAGIIFPCFNSKGQIIRLRIRDDFPMIEGNYNGKEGYYMYACTEDERGWFFKEEDKDAKVLVNGIRRKTGEEIKTVMLNKNWQPDGKVLGKYKNLTSYKEQEVEEGDIIRIVNKYQKGTKSGSSISLYMKKGDDIRTVYITEGEKKAMVINAFTGCPVISLPGVSSYSKLFEPEEGCSLSIMDVLKAAGVINVVLMYDADKNSNEQVAFNEKNAMAAILLHGFILWVGDWLQYFGKGSDDCYIAGVQPILHRVTAK